VDFVHDEDANVGKREETIGYGEGQIPVETARNAKEEGVSGSELIKRVKQGQDISEFEENHVEERIPRSPKPKELPPSGLHKIELPQYSRGRLKVYLVNGEYVRDNLDVNFTMGGHGHVYDYIPKNEVWIEKGGEPLEDKFTLLHELVEREQMVKGMDYEEAHENYANVAEMKARENPRLLNDMIAEQLGRIPQRKRRVERYEPIDELDSEVERTMSEKKREPVIIGSGGTRYYLGYPIRPPELGGNL
jgi:hypothetical protein